MSRVSPAAGAAHAPAPPPPKPDAVVPPAVDVTVESDPDGLASLSDRATRRAELILVARRLKDADRQADIDKIHSDFDANAAERAEYQRQMNVLRDIAMEQQKRDDEILKKWIALI